MGFEDSVNRQVENAINEHWPKIIETFQKTVGASALETAKNDNVCEVLFTQVYKQLPFPIRLVVKKDIFVQYCFTHRDKLV